MKYCSECGAPIHRTVPEGDNRIRDVCTRCATVHYQNPKIVVGCIPEWEDKVLLCRRAIEPRYGMWTLPAGFLENGETTWEGAARETAEEARARVEMGDLYALFSLPHIDQVHLFYRCRLLDLDFAAGDESLEVRLFSQDAIPWGQMAFPVVIETLNWLFEDRAAGRFVQRNGEIIRTNANAPGYRIRLLGR